MAGWNCNVNVNIEKFNCLRRFAFLLHNMNFMTWDECLTVSLTMGERIGDEIRKNNER